MFYLFYLHLLFTQLLCSVLQNLSYLCNLNWISTKDQLQWSECSSKNVCLLFYLERNEFNIFQRKFLFLGKLPRLLRLCWVILMGISQHTQWCRINIMWQWLLSTKLLCNRIYCIICISRYLSNRNENMMHKNIYENDHSKKENNFNLPQVLSKLKNCSISIPQNKTLQ